MWNNMLFEKEAGRNYKLHIAHLKQLKSPLRQQLEGHIYRPQEPFLSKWSKGRQREIDRENDILVRKLMSIKTASGRRKKPGKSPVPFLDTASRAQFSGTRLRPTNTISVDSENERLLDKIVVARSKYAQGNFESDYAAHLSRLSMITKHKDSLRNFLMCVENSNGNSAMMRQSGSESDLDAWTTDLVGRILRRKMARIENKRRSEEPANPQVEYMMSKRPQTSMVRIRTGNRLRRIVATPGSLNLRRVGVSTAQTSLRPSY